jgi:hypothetical protein
MGGSGGGFFPSKPRNMGGLIGQAQNDSFQKELESDINRYSQELLRNMNDRDVIKTKKYLDDIKKIVGDKIELDGFLFGGSVAKHTYVDGLSDIDVLAIVNKEKWKNKEPQFILKVMERYLKNKLTANKITSVTRGDLAVTINYRDGTQLQILPAIKSGQKILINDPKNKGWNETAPKIFMKRLSDMNSKLSNMLLPTIKLVKSIISKLPEQKQPSGYHIENLAVQVFANYKGSFSYKSMIQHFFNNAGNEALKSIRDVTGQSKTVDSYLGSSNSIKRKIVADGFASISRKLNATYTLDQWKKMCE